MILIKKKVIQVLSNGSLHFDTSILKKLKKVKIVNKDHTNFDFNKKSKSSVLNVKEFESFKSKYFKF